MDKHQLINQSSGTVDYGTPTSILAAAREVMGSIELDPASATWANRRVGADRYLTVEDDGLSIPWLARSVWLNHPFGRDNRKWIEKLINDYKEDHFQQACCITYACTSEAWFKPLQAFPQCYLSPRTNYYLPDGTLTRGVPKGSVVTYLGPNVGKFYRTFERVYQLGKVQLPASMFDNLMGG